MLTQMFARLAVFTGGWSLEGAEEVCAADMPATEALTLLESLVEKSLVQAQPTADDIRYHFLETVHEFAWEKLEQSGNQAEPHTLHAQHYLQKAQHLYTEILRSGDAMQRMEIDMDNMRAGMDWAASRN